MSFIEANDLVKVYRTGKLEVQALRGLNINVKKGEFVAIVGPSGSGKTTLLNILGGLDDATAGTASVAGRLLNKMTEKERVEFRRLTVGHIFQALNLIPTLTAKENIGLPMIAAGVLRKKRNERIKELLEILGIEDRSEHKPGELSGGEQQRVAIAAALANDPPVILADEPTGELDSENARQTVGYLKKIHRDLGKTILMVTHDPTVARQTERILRIEDGKIMGQFTPSDMGTEPGASSYSEQIRKRIDALSLEIQKIEDQFKKGHISADEFVTERTRLIHSKKALRDELHRMGV
ncbi:MAG: ABC transporter ATP-binding protein [Candidatus Ranarchaeia archaeon]